MSWFTISILIATKPIELMEKEAFIYLEESVYLINAMDLVHASQKAMLIALEQVSDSNDSSLTINDRPATHEFVGIRDIQMIDNDIVEGMHMFEVNYVVKNDDTLQMLFHERENKYKDEDNLIVELLYVNDGYS